MSNIDKQALNQEKIEWLNKLADMEYCKSNPGHWLMSLKDTNMLAKLALRSVSLLDELEAKDKSIDFLKEQLAQLANFNPDWDKLEAATDSLREHIAKLSSAEKRIAELEGREVKPVKGEVLVTVSGFTGCGKSAIAGEIEIAMKAIGVPVTWSNGDAEKRMTGADWLTAIEMYKPTVRIIEVNVPRAAAAGKGEAS
ncbi:hypothetical protein UXP96_17215 [Enterobacter hormaechei]